MRPRRWLALRAFAALAIWAPATVFAFAFHAFAGAQDFGLGVRELFGGFYLAIMFTAPAFVAFVVVLPGCARRGLRIALGTLVATGILAHTHLAAEEAEFRAAVGDCMGQHHHRARAEPFGGWSIGCHEGEFFAHD
jgi:hypothetical protein